MGDETKNVSLTEGSTNDEMAVECEDAKDGLQGDVLPDNRLTEDTEDTENTEDTQETKDT